MAFREVGVFEVREVLRLWVRGHGYRGVERLAGVDRKTVRRYVGAAEELGLSRAGGEAQLADVFMAGVVERVRPHRSDGRGAPWRALEGHREQIRVWLEDEDLTVVKVGELLGRRGWWCRRAPCSVSPRSAAVRAGAGGPRCGWPMASPGASCRSTSAGWDWSWTRRPAATGCAGR